VGGLQLTSNIVFKYIDFLKFKKYVVDLMLGREPILGRFFCFDESWDVIDLRLTHVAWSTLKIGQKNIYKDPIYIKWISVIFGNVEHVHSIPY
jgi:hypothetical protein